MVNRKYSKEVVALCKQFFVKGWSIADISKEMNVELRTLHYWKKDQHWNNEVAADSVEITIAKRINVLAERDNKTEAELNELAKLCETFGNLKVQLATAQSIKNGVNKLVPGHVDYACESDESDESDKGGKQQAKRKSKGQQKREKKIKNDISSISEEQLDEILRTHFYDYQREWYARKNDPLTCRNRFILKSRQIGATYYFSFEALDDAIRTGDNQIFLSASRDQAEVFKAYIIAFALEHFDVELKGQGVITLSNGAELRFLSTNSRTACSYHGHLYVDECFYIPKFNAVWDASSGMAAHKKWRRTLFSTPSATNHEAYPMWSGQNFNKGRTDETREKFDISHKALKNGVLGADKYWRHMVTIKDAQSQGCNLFDIDELKLENSPSAFDNKFMCIWVDGAQSVFKIKNLLDCVKEQPAQDYNEKAPRPFNNRPVAIGYDPSRTRDPSSLAILAIPIGPNEKWRVLKTYSYRGQNFQFQANRIKEICDSHNVKYIGIDTTGMGRGVFELVEKFYARATPIHYSNDTKTELVIKALDVIENKKIEFDIQKRKDILDKNDGNIVQSFMMITQSVSNGSGQVIYSANRTAEAGHADKAWAIMHALHSEPIAPRKKTTVSVG